MTAIKQRANKWYGWRPDIPDARDFKYQVKSPGAPLQSVHLKDKFIMPDVFDQGNLGSCTANGIAWALAFLFLNHLTKAKHKLQPPFSRLFIYFLERVMEGTVGEDAGAEIRDGIKAVAKQGACIEAKLPYDISKFKNKPSKSAYDQAKGFQALLYERIDNTDKRALVDALNQGFPIIKGFTVYTSFESTEVERTGEVPMPNFSQEWVEGGHCTNTVGYNADTDRFEDVNSWGPDWGKAGYYTMPAAYLTNPNLADDFWIIKLIE